MPSRVYEVVAETLKREGVEVVFGLMGDGNMRLVNRLTAIQDVKFIACRHEGSAVAAADGYARVTGDVGVVTTTQGPGVTNAITALMTAARAASPVVFLAAATRPGAVGAMQQLDQLGLFGSLGVKTLSLERRDPGDAVRRALAQARALQQPVVVNMPLDIQDALAEPGEALPAKSSLTHERQPVADGAAVIVAVEYLLESRRPMILAGRGAMKSRARADLIALSEATGAILATTLMANGMFAGEARNVGVCGGMRTQAAEPLLASSDCVLAFGASLNGLTTHHNAMFSSARRVIQVDIDPEAIGRLTPIDLGIVGDAGTVARAMLAELKGKKPTHATFGSELFPLARPETTPVSATDYGSKGADPVELMARLNHILPANRTLVSDGGHSMGFSGILFDVVPDAGYVSPVDFGSIGLAMGAALGSACAANGRRTILTIGDGALLMSLGDLETAARHGLPLIAVVLDDAAYGAELHHLAVDGDPFDQSLFEEVDFAAVARGLGWNAVQVRSVADLDGVGQLAADTTRPLLIDCKIDRGVRARWFDEMWSSPAPTERK